MALTKISTGGVKDDAASQAKIADEAIDEARLQVSNAGTNGQFLSKQSGNTGGLTWASVDTNLVSDTTPQLGGNLDVNTKNIIFGDSADGTTDDVLKFGAGTDLSIYSDGTSAILKTPDGQLLQFKGGTSGNAHWSRNDSFFVTPNLNVLNKVNINGAGGTAGQVLTSGGSSATSWANVPAGGNTVDLVADGAIAAGKPVIIKSNGKAATATSTAAPLATPVNTYKHDYLDSNAAIVGEHSRIAYDNDNDCYLAVYDTTAADLCYHLGTKQANNEISWGSKTVIQNNQNFNNLSLCYAGNSRFVLIYRNGNDSKSYVRIGKVSSGPAITWSSTNYVDGINGSIYNDPRPVKIANDRVAIICRRGGSDGKWTDGRVGVLVGDVTSDTAWTYRSHLELASHDCHSDFLSVAYNSTDDVTLAVWKKSNDTGHCRAFQVASGTSATITSSSETSFENNNDFQQNKTAWHSGQNKFITTFGRGGHDDIRSKITTVTISGGSISVSVGSAIDLSGTHPSGQHHNSIVLTITDQGAVWVFWITGGSGGNGTGDNRLYAITDDNFNGSTLAWSSHTHVITGYDGYFYTINGFFNSEHENRIVLFGQNYLNRPTYWALEAESVTTNMTTTTNIIGFAEDAINDTATGTIKLYGNVVGNQSSLTAGTLYYHKPDGSLSTSGDNTIGNMKAGMALSATKLLIYNPLT